MSISSSHLQYNALLDTGAQRSVLTESVIAEQELVRVGHMQFSGLHGPQTHTRYLASFGFWVHRETENATEIQREITLYNLEKPFEIVNMRNNQNFDLIIGFDILKYFSFRYDGKTNEFCLIVQE